MGNKRDEPLSCVWNEVIHQADDDKNGSVGMAEFLQLFEDVKQRVSQEDFETLVEAVEKMKAITCYLFDSCADCARDANGGQCGWFDAYGTYKFDSVPERKLQADYFYGSTTGSCFPLDEDLVEGYGYATMVTESSQCSDPDASGIDSGLQM